MTTDESVHSRAARARVSAPSALSGSSDSPASQAFPQEDARRKAGDVLDGLSASRADNDFSESLATVGVRLREARGKAGLSLRDFSKRSGLSTSFLSLVERGECSLSLTSLFTIANTLGVSPVEMLDGAVASRHDAAAEYSLWRGLDASPSHTVVGEREYFPFAPNMKNRALEPLFFRVHPTTVISPLASHDGEEVGYVISGSLYIRLRDEELTLSAGESIHFASRVPHTIANLTSTVVDTLWVTTRSLPAEEDRTNPVTNPTL